MWRKWHGWLAVATISVVSAQVGQAQGGSGRGFLFRAPTMTLSVHGGYAIPGARSDFFDFTTDELTLSRSDFAGAAFGGDLGFRLGEQFEIVLGASHSASSDRSEFRDWVDADDQPIEQVTRFSRTPVALSFRYHPRPSGRKIGSFAWIPTQFDPYFGAGIGKMKYIFEQSGDFIDFDTEPNVVFTDRFRSSGWVNMFQASAGAGWTLAPRLQLTGEVRYQHARADMGDDFVGFEKLDLSGVSTNVGLAIRF